MPLFIKVFIVFGLVLTASCETLEGFNPFASAATTYDEPTTMTEPPAESAPIKIKPIQTAPISEPLKPNEVTPASSHIKTDTAPASTSSSFTDTAMATISKFIPKSSLGQVKAGLLLPLSGKSKAAGEAMQSAAMIALAETNNKDFVLQFYDTQGTPEGAKSATEKALAEGVDIILGPLFSFEAEETASAVGWGDVKIISFSSDPDILSDKVFSVAPLLTEQVTEIVKYACSQGHKKFALLAQNNKMGDYAFSAAKSAAESESCQGEITVSGFYDPLTTDFSMAIKDILPEALLAKLERESLKEQGYEVLEEPLYDSDGNLIDEENITFDFDAVLLIDEGARLRSLGALLEYYDISPKEIQFLGVSMMDDANVRREPSLLGAWYTTLPKEGFNRFAAKYKNLTGSKKNPPRIASLAFDAVSLAAFLAAGDGIDTYTLTNPAGFKGVDGIFRFLPDGRAERALAVMEVTRSGKNKVLKAAPKSFTDPAPEAVKPVSPAEAEKADTSAKTEEESSSILDIFKPKEPPKEPVYEDAPRIEPGYFTKP